MFSILGWLVVGAILSYASVFVLFTTIDTFAQGLFSGRWYEKLLATSMWVALLTCWIWWFSVIEVNV
jgi:hypothetical protein